MLVHLWSVLFLLCHLHILVMTFGNCCSFKVCPAGHMCSSHFVSPNGLCLPVKEHSNVIHQMYDIIDSVLMTCYYYQLLFISLYNQQCFSQWYFLLVHWQNLSVKNVFKNSVISLLVCQAHIYVFLYLWVFSKYTLFCLSYNVQNQVLCYSTVQYVMGLLSCGKRQQES